MTITQKAIIVPRKLKKALWTLLSSIQNTNIRKALFGPYFHMQNEAEGYVIN